MSKGQISNGQHVVGEGIAPLNSCGIADQRIARKIVESLIPIRKIGVIGMDVKGHQRPGTVKSGSVQPCYLGGNRKATDLRAPRKSIVAYAFQLAVISKDHARKSDGIIERVLPDLRNRIGNRDRHGKVQAAVEGIALDLLQMFGKLDLAKPNIILERFPADGGNGLALDEVGNRDIALMSRIGKDFHRAISLDAVGIGQPLVFIGPFGIQSRISEKLILARDERLCTLWIEIPTIEHKVRPLRSREVQNKRTVQELLLNGVHLVCQHIERDHDPRLQDQCTHIQSAVSVIPIKAGFSYVVAGGIEQLYRITDGSPLTEIR